MNIMYASQPNNFGYPGAGIPPTFPQIPPPQPPQQQYYGNSNHQTSGMEDHMSQQPPPPPYHHQYPHQQPYQTPNNELMQHVRINCCRVFNDWSNCPFTRGFLWSLVAYLVLSLLVVLATFEFIGTPLKMVSTALAFVAIKKQHNVLMAVFTGILAYDLVEWVLIFIGLMPSLYHVHRIPTFSYWILGLHFIVQQGLFAMSIVHLKKGPNPHNNNNNHTAMINSSSSDNESITGEQGSTDTVSSHNTTIPSYDQYAHHTNPFQHTGPCPPPPPSPAAAQTHHQSVV